MKTAILLLSLVALVFCDFRIGGSTCLFGDSCSAYTGSAIIDITDGVNVDSDNVCAAGQGSTRGVSYTFEVEVDGFWSFYVEGLAADAALLVFEGDAADADGCSAWLTISSSWAGFTEAGTYTAVVTYNNGEADSCLNFTATGTEIPYEYTGPIDTDIQGNADITNGFCSLSTVYSGSFTFTPTEATATHYSAYGQFNGDVEGVVAVVTVFATADIPADMNDTTTMCDEYTNNAVAYDTANSGYPLTANTEYTFFVKASDLSTFASVMGDFYMNVFQSAPTVTVEEVCDILPATPKDYDRPSVPTLKVTDECTLNGEEYVFDVVHTSYPDEVFFVVDTISCGDNSFDGAVVLYYGKQGTEATDSADAVAPTTCDGFVLSGDSGDGGAAYYWFPADADITVVPTTYSTSSDGGSYTLVMSTYDIVGCVPENPYIVVDDTDSSIALVASFAIFLVALF